MKFAIQHQHYWKEDKQQKEDKVHTHIIDIAEDFKQAKIKLAEWEKRKEQSIKNMTGALKILHDRIGIPLPDFKNFTNEMTIKKVDDNAVVDEKEAQHVFLMSVTSAEQIAFQMFMDVAR